MLKASESWCLHRTSNFTAVGITIANCKQSSSRGTIVVCSRSAVSLKHTKIENNKITGVYVKRHANATLQNACFVKNEVFGNGAAIHAKRNAFITIADSLFISESNAKAKELVPLLDRF